MIPLPELSRRRRRVVLVICSSSLFIVGLDSTIVNIALPDIGRDLHASVAGLQWTVDGYALVLASLLMLSGATADRIGRRRVFQIGLAAFGLGSLLCGLAPGIGWLIAARVLQAGGGTMLNPVAMSIIVNTFPDRGERPGHRRLERRVRPVHFARAGRRRAAGRLDRVAGHVLREHPGRPGRDRADRPVRAGVAGPAAATA